MLRAAAAWDFPNALVPLGGNEFDAAQREVAAETGLADLDFPFGDAHREALPSAAARIASYYLAETEEGDVKLPRERGREQHDEWRWVTFDEAEDLLPPRLAVILEWARATIGGS